MTLCSDRPPVSDFGHASTRRWLCNDHPPVDDFGSYVHLERWFSIWEVRATLRSGVHLERWCSPWKVIFWADALYKCSSSVAPIPCLPSLIDLIIYGWSLRLFVTLVTWMIGTWADRSPPRRHCRRVGGVGRSFFKRLASKGEVASARQVFFVGWLSSKGSSPTSLVGPTIFNVYGGQLFIHVGHCHVALSCISLSSSGLSYTVLHRDINQEVVCWSCSS